MVHRRQFLIKRGVKQGRIFSPLLFNPGLEYAMKKTEASSSTLRIHCGDDELRMKVRHGDDLMQRARSDRDIVSMVDSLVEEFAADGLHFK